MLQPTWYPNDKQLRQFAVISLFGFGLFGWIVRWRMHAPTAGWVLWIIGAATMLIGVPFPRAVMPVYTLLTAVALPIGWLVSNIVLRVVYYGILTPIGLVFRLKGRDSLQLKRRDVRSYWTPFHQEASPESYYRQS